MSLPSVTWSLWWLMETLYTVIFNLWVWEVKFKHTSNRRNLSSKTRSWVSGSKSQRMCEWKRFGEHNKWQKNVDSHPSVYPQALILIGLLGRMSQIANSILLWKMMEPAVGQCLQFMGESILERRGGKHPWVSPITFRGHHLIAMSLSESRRLSSSVKLRSIKFTSSIPPSSC